jgi:hypothetical protein
MPSLSLHAVTDGGGRFLTPRGTTVNAVTGGPGRKGDSAQDTPRVPEMMCVMGE